ncbi:MAG: hypothetical protein ACJ749_11710 [Flavisolibacter sp.]
MKNIFFALYLLFVMNAKADIEYSPADVKGKATAAEITNNRSCFQELENEGCGNPGDDVKQFRSCMNNVYPRLSDGCQKMMSNLYGTK